MVDLSTVEHLEIPGPFVTSHLPWGVGLPKTSRPGDLAVAIEADDGEIPRLIVGGVSINVVDLNVFSTHMANATGVVGSKYNLVRYRSWYLLASNWGH